MSNAPASGAEGEDMPGKRILLSRRGRSAASGAPLAAGGAAQGDRPDRARPRRAQRPLRPARRRAQCGGLWRSTPSTCAGMGRLRSRRSRPFRRRGRLGEMRRRPLDLQPPDRRRAAGRPDRPPRPFDGLVPRPGVRRRAFGRAGRRRSIRGRTARRRRSRPRGASSPGPSGSGSASGGRAGSSTR